MAGLKGAGRSKTSVPMMHSVRQVGKRVHNFPCHFFEDFRAINQFVPFFTVKKPVPAPISAIVTPLNEF